MTKAKKIMNEGLSIREINVIAMKLSETLKPVLENTVKEQIRLFMDKEIPLKELADRWKVKENTLRKRCSRGQIKYHKRFVGTREYIFFYESEINPHIQESSEPSELNHPLPAWEGRDWKNRT